MAQHSSGTVKSKANAEAPPAGNLVCVSTHLLTFGCPRACELFLPLLWFVVKAILLAKPMTFSLGIRAAGRLFLGWYWFPAVAKQAEANAGPHHGHDRLPACWSTCSGNQLQEPPNSIKSQLEETKRGNWTECSLNWVLSPPSRAKSISCHVILVPQAPLSPSRKAQVTLTMAVPQKFKFHVLDFLYLAAMLS